MSARSEPVPVTFRRAVRADVPAIVRMMSDDPLGASREQYVDPLPPAYLEAFSAIDADPRQLLVVGEAAGVVLATAQLTYLPGLSHRGSWRAQVEAVRVDAAQRGRGIGEALMQWLLEQARERGCRMVQLTTHRSRTDAHRFYERLGFVPSHVGMKLVLD